MSNDDDRVVTAWLTDISQKIDRLDTKLNRTIYIVIGVVIILIAINPSAVDLILTLVKVVMP
jgi:hypothetical protein